ncbi:hypothetical protein [Ferrimonas marina]|uniref:Aerolysin/Pertussis toxin (APT) domain-containing protein n=1 Tax=Ferrimonas marina TaxID=299255 RepID=A0A1M5VM16_9GAMM|nr:hypothetical protein [Ferrimonas marina]SHH76292.1 hypothetical protein SAMN02745129_2852 [Ferrimonas marina]
MKHINQRLATLMVAGICSLSAHAGYEPTDYDKVNQYFYGYQNEFDNGGGKWGIIDDLDLWELKEAKEAGADLPDHLKSLYVDETCWMDGDTEKCNQKLLFDVQWTGKTLKRLVNAMYGDGTWEDAKGDKDARKALRQAVRETCDARLEIGYARTYGIDGEGYAAELDTDLNARGSDSGCSALKRNLDGAEAATVRMRTFIPTIPGAKYSLYVKYQKRDYNYERTGAPSEEKAYRDLFVKVQGKETFESEERLDPFRFPLPDADGLIDGEMPALEQGFVKQRINFVADRYFTAITLKDTGYPDSFGILIRGLHVSRMMDGPNQEECLAGYPYKGGAQKKCLLNTDPEIDFDACDLSNGDFTHKKLGKLAPVNARLDEANLFAGPGADQPNINFYSLGQGGKANLRLGTFISEEQFLKGSCPVYGKTLSLSEVTWNNKDFAGYPEKGIVKAKLQCQGDEGKETQWVTLSGDANPGFVSTGEQIAYPFGAEYMGCRLASIHFTDKTHKLKGQFANPGSDGLDINGLSLTETPMP